MTTKHIIDKATGKAVTLWGEGAPEGEHCKQAVDRRDADWQVVLQNARDLAVEVKRLHAENEDLRSQNYQLRVHLEATRKILRAHGYDMPEMP